MRIFISYRRADAQLTARAMKTFLDRVPAVTDVFLDFDEIAIGADFAKVINDTLRKSDVCLVLIGDKYLDGGQSGPTPRIFEPQDFVRREAALALQSDTKVVPILIDGAEMPNAASLPEDLHALPSKNGFQLRTSHFEGDMFDLLDGAFDKDFGKRWLRPPLKFGGVLKRVLGGAFVAALFILIAMVVHMQIAPFGCESFNCTLGQTVFADLETPTERFNAARSLELPVYAIIIALGAFLPFLWRWMRR